MRKPLAAGNWKMNGTLASVRELLTALKQGAASLMGVELAVFPPFVYLAEAAHQLQGTALRWGAQNASERAPGAFTGEVAAAMLNDFGCHYVLTGHSERRTLYGEGNDHVAAKFAAVQQAGLVPVLCVGETLAEREQGITERVVAQQLEAVLTRCGAAAFHQAVIAYEPVWAIGTGKTATPAQAQEVHAFIRSTLVKLDAKMAASVRILYGGSVTGANAAELFTMPDVDGGLVGGASLRAQEFLAIAQQAARDAS